MEQLNVPEDQKLPIDYEDLSFPESVRKLRPLVFNEDDTICVILGPDRHEGVAGSGATIEEALKDWDAQLSDRIRYHKGDDEIALYIIDAMKASVNKVW
jgi:hypothetical protein